MLDPIITSYKHTSNMNSYLIEYLQYLVNNTYNLAIVSCMHHTIKSLIKFEFLAFVFHKMHANVCLGG